MAQQKSLPLPMQEIWVTSMGREYPPEQETATRFSIPWKEEPARLQSTGLQRAGHDLVTVQRQHNNAVISTGLKHPWNLVHMGSWNRFSADMRADCRLPYVPCGPVVRFLFGNQD